MDSAKRHGTIERLRAALRNRAFEALYGPLAWAYDWVSRTFFMGQWRHWQRASMRYLTGRRVLEVGMGTGNLQVDLAGAGFEAWGIDLSRQMVREAVRKARQLGPAPFRACRARAQAIPFPGAAFDSVVSTFPSDYIVDPDSLREVERVLRPGGRLVVVAAGWLTGRDASSKAFEGVARLVYGYRGESRAEAVARQARDRTGAFDWVGKMEQRMAEAGLAPSTRLLSSGKGACLIVIGEKAGEVSSPVARGA